MLVTASPQSNVPPLANGTGSTEDLPDNRGNLLGSSFSHISIRIQTPDNIEGLEVADAIHNITLWEAIDSLNMTGEITFKDDSGLLAGIPVLGQELVSVVLTPNKGQPIALVMYITEVFNVIKTGKDTSAFKVRLTSTVDVLDAQNILSRSFSGTCTDIIRNIFKTYLNHEISNDYTDEVEYAGTQSSENITIVFPYIKPLDAVSQLLQRSYTSKNSPVLLFETLFKAHRLVSVDELWNNRYKPPRIIRERAIHATASNVDGKNLLDNVKGMAGRLTDWTMTNGYNTLGLTNSGAYSANSTISNISHKTVEDYQYRYNDNKSTKSNTNEFVSPRFQSSSADVGKILSQDRSPDHRYIPSNSMAFGSDDLQKNISTVDPMALMSYSSNLSRYDAVKIEITCDPIAGLMCGDIIELELKSSKAELTDKMNVDPLTSGKYLVSAIKHAWDAGKYNQSIELIRDGIGMEYKKNEG
jgi:hypothetical protein